ncbi:SH3 domain-containing protein [Clostridium chrysemydis]|uniref:SH3 domain-containing protein n=1 Tax=Clostridium chrysemydis TaxID=2665504 RepID=UPI0018839D53|nr:SH3 domain-containing protein [Clostridium chrysemydis]
MKSKKIKVLIAIGAIASTIAITPITTANADTLNINDAANTSKDNAKITEKTKQENLVKETKNQMFKTENTIDLAKTNTDKDTVKNAIDEFVKVKISKELVELQKFQKINEYQFNSLTDLISKLPKEEQKEVIRYFKDEMTKYFTVKDTVNDNLETKVKNLSVKNVSKEENKTSDKTEVKTDSNEAVKVDNKASNNSEVKPVDKNKDKQGEVSPETKPEDKISEKEEAKQKDKVSDKTEVKIDSKVSDKTSEKLEDTTDKKVDTQKDKQGEKLQDKQEDKKEDKNLEKKQDYKEIKPEVKPSDKEIDKSKVQPNDKGEAKEEGKTSDKKESKPEAKPENKPEAKPENKPEAKPEIKPETKPEERPVKLENKFHSAIQEKLYHYLLNSDNRKSIFKEAVRLHDGNASNTCVYFASEALRRIGVDIPKYIAYTTKLEEQLVKRSWVKTSDLDSLEPGDICFAGEAHTYVFMGWADRAKHIAEVADNQVYRFGDHYHNRGLYTGYDVTPTTHYYKYVQGAFEKDENVKTIVKGTVSVDSYLNVRSDASTSARVLGKLYGGDSVNILGKDGEWYKIDFNGDDGYVFGTYIKDIEKVIHKEEAKPVVVVKPIEKPLDKETKPSDSKETAKPEVKPEVKPETKPETKPEVKPEEKEETKHIKIEHSEGRVVNISSYLNVRSDNSTNSRIVGSLRNGSKVSVKGKDGDFYKIDFNGRDAYVYEKYLSVKTWTEDKVIKVVHIDSKDENKKNDDKKEETKKQEVKTSLVGTIRVHTYLNVRNDASTHSRVIGRLKNNDKVDIIKKHGSFYEIKFDGKTGYIHKDYVSVRTITENSSKSEDRNDKIESNNKVGRVVNVTSNLRVRDGASTRYLVKGYLSPNATVKVVGSKNGWYKIEYNGGYGFVSSDFIKLI